MFKDGYRLGIYFEVAKPMEVGGSDYQSGMNGCLMH